MCNIAGYIGERDAAPILIEMIRAQEGQNGGFYTGIATMHEGKIHYRKLVGSLDDLLKRTDAASLPGKLGIIHSRTPGFAGDEWSPLRESLKFSCRGEHCSPVLVRCNIAFSRRDRQCHRCPGNV